MSVRSRVPGLALAVGLAIAAYALVMLPGLSLLSPMLVAILLGIAVRNLGAVPAAAAPGLTYVSKTLLRAGIVLLGLRLALPDVLALGTGPLVVIAGTVAATFATALALGRSLRVASTVTVLTGTGTAICGASAVAGMAAVVRQKPSTPTRRDEPVESAAATALAVVTLCGTLAMFALPALASWLGLSDRQAGVWIGSAVHEVGQVVAAGGFMSAQVTEVATLTKLGRVVLLAPLVALVGFWQGRDAQNRHGQGQSGQGRPPLVPAFVLGFVGAVLVRSALAGAGWEEPLAPVLDGVQYLTGFVLACAMAAVGTAVNLWELLARGGRALLFGVVLSAVTAGVALALTLALV